jgi:hypothetical protein
MLGMLRSPGGLVAIVCLVAASAACRKQSEQGPPAAPPPPAAPQPTTAWVLSIAGFEHDDLVECNDMEVRLPPTDADVSGRAAKIKAFADDAWGRIKPVGARLPTRLQRPCAEQFRDRKAFAVCSDVSGDKDGRIRARVFHYSFADVFRSDAAMKECIEQSGTWDAMSRESREFHEAQLRFDTLEAQRQMKKLMPKE